MVSRARPGGSARGPGLESTVSITFGRLPAVEGVEKHRSERVSAAMLQSLPPPLPGGPQMSLDDRIFSRHRLLWQAAFDGLVGLSNEACC